MKRNNNLREYNLKCAMEACSGNDIGKDHYDGLNGQNGFMAYKIIDSELSFTERIIQTMELLVKLSKLEIPPTIVWINDEGMIEVDWLANDYQVVSNRKQYLALVLEFVMFLEDSDLDLLILPLMFNLKLSPIEDLTKANYSPSFNTECFGSDFPFEIAYNETLIEKEDYYNYLATIENYYID